MNKITSFRDEYAFLSNFYEIPVIYKGLTYQNSEAAFQAQKCVSEDERKDFTILTASQAKRAGCKVQLRPDWEQIKISEMLNIVRAKFRQNADLAKLLLDTGDAYIEEGNTWGDTVWGTVNGKGANNLGIILMKVRDELKGDIS